jgi:hypothetical protein
MTPTTGPGRVKRRRSERQGCKEFSEDLRRKGDMSSENNPKNQVLERV